MAALQDRTPMFGKDILARMLDMEKLSQVQRQSGSTPRSTSMALTPSSSNPQTPRIPAQRQQSMPQQSSAQQSTSKHTSVQPVIPQQHVPYVAPPKQPQRSKTAPELKLDMAHATAKVDQTGGAVEPPSPSICHSPTWSVRGKDKSKDKSKQSAKKAAKEKKELEKKELEKRKKEEKREEKKEEEKRKEEKKRGFALKPNNRLSKKPPPAMETQRLPASLSRPSDSIGSHSRDPSADRSRPSSKDGRRSSISSITSIMRKTPPFLSRRNSNTQLQFPQDVPRKDQDLHTQKSQQPKPTTATKPTETRKDRRKSPPPNIAVDTDGEDGEDDRYTQDLSDFAYQLNAGQLGARSADNTPEVHGLKGSPLPSPLFINPDQQQPTSPAFAPQKEITAQAAVPSNVVPDPRTSGVRDNTPRGYNYPSVVNGKLHKSHNTSPYPSAVAQSSSLPNLAPQNANSYVNKQRLHEQQSSISSFREEVAISQAMNSSGSDLPPTPPESTESMGGRTEKSLSRTRDPAGLRRGSAPLLSIASSAPSQSEEQKRHLSMPYNQESYPTGSSKNPGQSSITTKWQVASPLDMQHTDTMTTSTVNVQKTAIESRPEPTIQRPTGMKTESPDRERGSSHSTDRSQQRSDTSFTETSEQAYEAPRVDEQAKPRSFKISGPPFSFFSRSNTSPAVPAATQQTGEIHETESNNVASNTTSPGENISPKLPSRSPLRNQIKSTSHEHATFQDTSVPLTTGRAVVVEGVDGDGLIRKTSIRRPRSDPELNVDVNLKEEKPEFDFLPELKHQPLMRPKRNIGAKVSFAPEPEPIPKTPSQFPVPGSKYDLTNPADILALPQAPFDGSNPGVKRQSAIRANKRSSFGPSQVLPMENKSAVAGQALTAKPLAKMFVICCKCKYWHDLPSSLYEAMAIPKTISQEDGIAQSVGASHGFDNNRPRVAGKVFTTVRCPWCEHGMSTSCCAGWTSIVYLHERHH